MLSICTYLSERNVAINEEELLEREMVSVAQDYVDVVVQDGIHTLKQFPLPTIFHHLSRSEKLITVSTG